MIKSSSRRMAGLALALCSTVAVLLLALAAPALAETCPNEEFRTGAGANLPDCRGYELVTPPFKEGALAELRGATPTPLGMSGVSADGSHVDVTSFGNFGDAKSGVFANDYELTRTESGWTETNIDLPASQFPESEPVDTTPEMEEVLYEARATDQPLKAKDLWLREADGALRDIGPFEPPVATEGPTGQTGGAVEEGGGGGFVAASTDLSHVIFSSPVAWPGDEAYSSLYEYAVGRGGQPMPVGVEPGGSPCAAGFDDISADGSTVFFECSGELLARIDNGEADARTVAVAEPSLRGPTPQFWTATPDGRYVFYIEDEELWRFDVQSKTRELLAGSGAGVQSGVAASEDGEYVYFLATGVLAGRNGEGEEPIAGQTNLYLGHGGVTTFVAGVAPGSPSATPNGEFLVFTSTVDLTPGDTSTARQVFEYDAQTGRLVRVSVGQNGFNDNGNTSCVPNPHFGTPCLNEAELPYEYLEPGATHEPRATRALAVSNDGAYVVFQSPDGLTPGALNGTVETSGTGTFFYLENVYEYHDGNVYLISDGQDTSNVGGNKSAVEVVGMSSSGGNIFFVTADQLVAQDVDTELDLYDARIDGGFPAPISLLPSCSGDACQGELSPAPTLLSPGSEFQAGGNPPLAAPIPAAKVKPKAKRCKKGFVKERSRCVAKKKAKRAAKSTRGKR